MHAARRAGQAMRCGCARAPEFSPVGAADRAWRVDCHLPAQGNPFLAGERPCEPSSVRPWVARSRGWSWCRSSCRPSSPAANHSLRRSNHQTRRATPPELSWPRRRSPSGRHRARGPSTRSRPTSSRGRAPPRSRSSLHPAPAASARRSCSAITAAPSTSGGLATRLRGRGSGGPWTSAASFFATSRTRRRRRTTPSSWCWAARATISC